MKIQKVEKDKANYPLKKVINPIILGMSIAVTFSGCLANRPPERHFKPISKEDNSIKPFRPVYMKEANNKNNEVEEDFATGGYPVPPPDYKSKK